MNCSFYYSSKSAITCSLTTELHTVRLFEAYSMNEYIYEYCSEAKHDVQKEQLYHLKIERK